MTVVGGEKKLIHWNTDSHTMGEIEAFYNALKKGDLNEDALHLTLCIQGVRVPKFSELKKLLHFLGPCIERGENFLIYCECTKTKKLLEFVGFQLVAKFINETP